MKSNQNKIILMALLVFLIGCKTRKFSLDNHDVSQNCFFKSYIENELNERDSNFDKAILLRTNFCGNELCSIDLYKSMEQYTKNEKKRVLIIVNYNDTTLTKILSNNTQIKVRIDQTEKYQKYGFQRPGHYAFQFNKTSCPNQYINITESFILWFEKQ